MSGVISTPRAVRIGDRQLPQDSALGVFHHMRLLFAIVVVSEQVQETMDGKMGKMMSERFTLAPRLARYGFVGQDDIAQMPPAGVLCREGQHVGCSVDAAPIAVAPGT